MHKQVLIQFLILGITLFFSNLIFCQNIDINYINPDFVEVCDKGKFEVILVNKSNDELTNITVEVLMPNGLSYIPGSVNDATELDISNLSKPVFSVPDFREDWDFDLEAETVCSLVADINNGKIFANTITAEYDQGRDRILTLPYRIETGFLVITDIDPENGSGIFSNVIERRITVRNTRIGKVEAVNFEDSHDGGISISTNGINPVSTANTYSAVFDGSHFQDIGNGDEFLDFNEEFVIVEQVTLTNCLIGFEETISNLTVSWGCDSTFCQSRTNSAIISFDIYPFEAVLEFEGQPNPNGNFCERKSYGEKITVTNTGDDLAQEVTVSIIRNETAKDTNSIVVTSGGVVIPFKIVRFDTLDNPLCQQNFVAGFTVEVGELPVNSSIEINWENYFCGVTCDAAIPDLKYTHSFRKVCPASLVRESLQTVYYDFPSVLKDSISFNLGFPVISGQQNEFRYDLISEIIDDSTGIIEVEFILPCGYSWSSRSLILDGKAPLSTNIDDSNIEAVSVTLQYELPFSSEHVWGNFYLDFVCLPNCNEDFEFSGLSFVSTCPEFFLECWFDALGASLLDASGQFPAGQPDLQFFDVTTRYVSNTPNVNCDISDCEEFDLLNICGGDIINIESHVFEAYLDFDAEFRRTNIGLKDSNDDRIPDDNSTAPLNEVRADRFLTGDTSITKAAGIVVNDLIPVESENVKFRVCFEQHTLDSGLDGTEMVEVIDSVELPLFTREDGIQDIDAFIRIIDKETGNEYQCPLNNIRTVEDRILEVRIINTRPVQPFDRWRLLSYTYELNLPNASQVPGSNIPPGFKLTEGDSVYFEARHKIVNNPGLATLALRHYTESAIYNGNVSVEERFSCGRPFHQFYLSGFELIKGLSNLAALPCDEFGSSAGSFFNLFLGRDNFFTNEVRNLLNIETWDLLVPEGYRMIIPSTLTMGMNNFPATVNNEPITPTQNGDLYQFDVLQFQNPPFDEGFYMNFDHRYEPLPIACTYRDRSNLQLATRTKYVHDFCRFEPTELDTFNMRAFNPFVARLSLNAEIPHYISDDQTANWDLILENFGPMGKNVWLYIESKSNDIFDFVLRNKDTNQEIVPMNGIYQLGDFERDDSTNYELLANIAFCGGDSLNLHFGWNCEPLQSIDEFVCDSNTYVVSVEAPHTALPQLEMIIDSPTDSIELCDTIPYHTIEIFNADLGIAYDMDFSVLMPPGMIIIPGTSQIAYSTASNNFIDIPDPVDLGNGDYSWKINDIQSIINANGLPGINDEPQNSFSIRFLSFANCRLIASSAPVASITGLNFCDESSNTLAKPGRAINIKGIVADYSSIITLNQDAEVTCGEELELFVNIEVSGTTALGDSVLITLPEGATYVDNSYQTGLNAANVPPLITQRGNFTILSWPISPGISRNSDIQFSFKSIGFSDDVCQDKIIQIQTIQNKEAFCKTSNADCDVFIQTGSSLINVDVKFPEWNLTSFNGMTGTNGFDYEISGNNSGDPSLNSFTIDYYLDADGNGSVSAGDNQVGTQLVNSTDIQSGSFFLSGTLNISEDEACSIIAVISSTNSCICNESQILLLNQSLNTQDYQVCTGESIEIGVSGVSGADYFWDNPFNLSCFDCPNPTFLNNNTTNDVQVFNYILTEDNGNCPRQFLIEVEVFPLPKILTTDQAICEGGSIELMVTSAQSVVWTGQGISDPSVLNPVVTPTQTTTYYADFTSGNCTNFDSVTVEVIPGPITDLGADTSYCDPMSAVELSTIFDANYTYFWEPSFLLSDPRIHNPTITTFTSSDFILTARDQSTGCSLKDTISIEFGTTPQLSTSDDVTICEGESVQLFVNGADVYSWSNPSTLDCGDCQSVTASPNTTTTYVITGTNASICETVDSITVFVEGMIQFTDETITICEGDSIEVDGVIYNQNAEIPIVTPSVQDGCDSTHTINLIVTPALVEEDFLLCEGDTAILFDEIITTGETVCRSFTSAIGCDSTHCFNVSITPKPVVTIDSLSFSIERGDSVLIEMPDGFDNYRWEPSIGLACDTCRTTMASPNQTTVYTGFVNDTGECEVEFRIVNVAVFNECSADNITMPNIFSPNNDGRNEIFRPLNIGVEEIISFRIFNRWGQMILDSNGNNSEWNGNYKNEPQPVGVYIYTLDIGCNGEFERRLSGDITLLK